MAKRLTKEDIRNATGTFNPVGHIVLGFENDAVTAEAAQALRDAGFDAEDILSYTGAEVTPRLREMAHTASEGAGFGYEITLMRRYLRLSEEGCGWLIVYAPDDEKAETITGIAKRLGVKCAVRYHRLANEDLI